MEQRELAAQMRATFRSPYTQYAHRVGQSFEFTGRVRGGKTDLDDFDIEVGPLFQIRFADGFIIDAWPEEVLLDPDNFDYAAVGYGEEEA